jgi:endonuclease YncB( thermonuclease family)
MDFFRRTFDVLRVLEVHDGDTFRLLLDTGFEAAAMPWLRLKDFSCPELSAPHGEDARLATAALLRDHLATCWVATFKMPPTLAAKLQERYGDSRKSFARYIAEVRLDDQRLLGDELLRLGFARRGAFVG